MTGHGGPHPSQGRCLPVVLKAAARAALAHGLDLNVVAEGVETEEQRKLLRLLRCDQMQGYLFSVPIAKDKMEEMLRVENEAITQRHLQCLEPDKQGFDERRLVRG